MSALWRRFGGEIAAASLGFVALTAAVVLLVDGVEQARAIGSLGASEWAIRVLAGLPGRVVAAVPVATALGAATVAEVWRRSGWLVGLASCGVGPVRLAAIAAVAGWLAGGVAVGLREIVAEPAAWTRAGEGAWTVVDGPFPEALPADRALVRADRIDATGASGVRVAWLAGGVLLGAGEADHAAWDGAAWAVDGGSALAWDPSGEEVPITLVLPSPDAWRAAALGAGPDAPASRLWGAPASPSRSAWLGDRIAGWIGAGLLSGLAVLLVSAAERRGVAWALGIAVAWRLLAGGAAAASAIGAWPAAVAVGLPLGLLAILALALGAKLNP
jgi:hypothetical protein